MERNESITTEEGKIHDVRKDVMQAGQGCVWVCVRENWINSNYTQFLGDWWCFDLVGISDENG